MADSPAAASNDKEERQDRAQRYRARAGDILKLTDGDILPDQRERYLKRALQQLAHETDLSLAYFLLRCVRQLLALRVS
jgi:hypothetical protein